MRYSTLAINAILGFGLAGLSGTASAVSCTADLASGNPNNPTITSTTFSADGTSACSGPIDGNVPPYDLNSSTDVAPNDMGLGYTDWVSVEKDNIGAGGEGSGLLQIAGVPGASGQWMFTGTNGYTELLLLIKGGNSFATFLVSGSANTWYDWYITPSRANGLSHMEIFGRNMGEGDDDDDDTDLPEPGSLALLGLGLMGLGMSRRRRSK
jgi:hypothetical protein